jgi:hypothetical protein
LPFFSDVKGKKRQPLTGFAGFQGSQPWNEINRIFNFGVCVMSNEPRRIFQIDGINGGVLNIAERPNEPFVLLVISIEGTEAQIKLNQEDFAKLAELKYILRFGKEAQEQPALRAVN